MSDNSYNIVFASIELVSKSLNPLPESGFKNEHFHFDFKLDLKINLGTNNAFVITEINIKEGVDMPNLAQFKTVCHFIVDNLHNILHEKSDDTPVMPNALEIILKSAGLSTTRGIIYSELRGTYLHNAILPLIDIGSLVNVSKQTL